MIRSVATFLVAVFAAATVATAQQSTSELRGRVADSQDAAMPGVTLLVKNEATGIYREVVSNDDGTYFVGGLPPGLYLVTAEVTGFRKFAQSGVRLDLGHTSVLDLQLQVGAAEAVTVVATTPLVDITTKQVGGNVTNREMVGLPSVNGNFIGMVALLPGVISNISTESFGSDAVSANGMDSRNNNFMLDGANNNDDVIGQRAGSQARLPIEAVQEFQVVTNQYDAEFGRTTGAIINAISKQGTNAYRGVAAGLFQDASMTKRDFFVTQNGVNKPETSLQTYRANLGGPIIQNKAHFFFNVERVMVDRATSITIPSHPELNASPVTQDRVWNTIGRVDHQINSNHTWAVRWLRESSPQVNQIVPFTVPVTLVVLPVSEAASREENDVDQTLVGTLNSVLGANRLNTFRLNFTQEDVAFANPNFNSNGQDQAALLPTLQFLTFVDQQSNVAQARTNNAYQVDDTLAWYVPGWHGDHDFKVGGQYEYVTARSTTQDNLNGTFAFRSDLPYNAADPRTYPERLQIRVPGALNRLQMAHFFSTFAQDKWHLGGDVTLSLGLRYDVEAQPIDEINNPEFSDPSKYPLDSNNLAPRIGITFAPGGATQGVVRGGYGRFYDKTHFELISNILTAGAFSDSFLVNFPTNSADPGPSNGQLPTDPFLVGGPTVNRALLAQRYPPGSTVKNTGAVTLDNPDRRIPYTDQLTAGYERQVSSNMSFSADYVHARARDQLMLQDLNPGLRTSTARTATVVRFDPNYSAAVNQPINAGAIDYDALEMAFVKRFSSNYSVRVSYTLADSRGNTSGAAIPISAFQLLDDLRLDMNEGPTNVDRRNNLVISGQAIVPRTKGLTFGWIVRALSGSHFTLTDSNTDPDQNGQFQEPLAAGTYTASTTAKNPFEVDFSGTRNGATGPGLFQIDLRSGYRFRPMAGRTLDAFIEVFNITNRANFENPTGDRRSTDFLNRTALRSGAVPTTVQLGLRFEF